MVILMNFDLIRLNNNIDKKIVVDIKYSFNKEELTGTDLLECDCTVKGEILNSFTDDNLVYSKTFEDFRVHNGIDISCERSQPVFSVGDGVVEDVLTDSLEGITVKINHGNGFQSVYKNLSSDKMVKKGEPVSKGQVISGVGETALFEAAQESHIHFELIYNGKQVNPEIYKEV
jgi:murein DD-endopeptidase MepM/ murein hydrolase activator NlpD